MYLASWSGGKDSCLACYKAIKSGIKISHLLHFVREFNLHGVNAEMIRLQAGLSDILIIQQRILSDFESGFKETVRGLMGSGIKGMVFGDIHLEGHRQWVERVCGELRIESVEPLWGKDTGELMQEFIENGFQAVIVSGQTRFINKEWIGQPLNTDFMEYLRASNLDICGENGEYHTFVTCGPLFRGRIEITEKEVISRNGYWFLDIKDYKVVL